MNLLWSNHRNQINKFQLKTYLFIGLYPNIENLNVHIWKYLTPVRLEPSTSRFLVRCFIHCPIDVTCK